MHGQNYGHRSYTMKAVLHFTTYLVGGFLRQRCNTVRRFSVVANVIVDFGNDHNIKAYFMEYYCFKLGPNCRISPLSSANLLQLGSTIVVLFIFLLWAILVCGGLHPHGISLKHVAYRGLG